MDSKILTSLDGDRSLSSSIINKDISEKEFTLLKLLQWARLTDDTIFVNGKIRSDRYDHISHQQLQLLKDCRAKFSKEMGFLDTIDKMKESIGTPWLTKMRHLFNQYLNIYKKNDDILDNETVSERGTTIQDKLESISGKTFVDDKRSKNLADNIVDLYKMIGRALEEGDRELHEGGRSPILEFIAQNMNPFGYNIQDKIESLAMCDDKYDKEHYNTIKDDRTKIRINLFRIYLGLEPYEDTLMHSSYTPSKRQYATAENDRHNSIEDPIISGGDKNEFDDSKEIVFKRGENYDFVEHIKQDNLRDIKRFMIEQNLGESFESLVSFVNRFNGLPGSDYMRDGNGSGFYSDIFSQFGNYTVNYVEDCEDKNMPYISYFDRWNLDITSEPEKISGLGSAVSKFKGKTLKKIFPHLDFDEHFIPIDIYGRIYKDEYEKIIIT